MPRTIRKIKTKADSRRRRVTFLISLLAAAVILGLADAKPIRLFELKLLDLRYQARGPAPIDDRILLVSIGDQDVEILGRWPWPRSFHADLVEILTAYGAEMIGFDILFGEPDEQAPESDAYLAQAMFRSGNVCLPVALAAGENGRTVRPIQDLSEASRALGFVNITPDEDGIVRRVPLEREGYEPFGLAMIPESLKRDRQSPAGLPADEGRVIVNYPTGTLGWPWTSYTELLQSFYDLQSGQKPAFDLESLRGRIVLIGSTWTGQPDIIETPLGSAYGVELHAGLINSYLTRSFIHPLPFPGDLALFLGLTLAAALVLAWRGPFQGGVIVGGLALGVTILALAAFSRWGLWVRLIDPLLGLVAAYGAGGVYHLAVVERKARQVRKAFAHYVSPEVVAELVADPERVALGGEVRELTVLFSDLRGFTTLSEGLSPDALGELLNEYFTAMTARVFDQQGTLDKFIGDALMAVFGAPLQQPDHARKACLTALAIVQELENLNARWQAQNRPAVKCGVGLNTGPVKVGNFGSRERFDYTVIGENVNLASRLEGLTKYYGVEIVLSRTTADQAGDDFLFRTIDLVRVKGSDKPAEILELIGLKESVSPETAGNLETWQRAWELYLARDWEEAGRLITEILKTHPGDGPALRLTERLDQFRTDPPPDDWDGSYSHLSK